MEILLKKRNRKTSLILKELSEAVKELNKIKAGKKKPNNADDFLKDLNYKSDTPK
jgi:hypothetical protein